MHKVLYPSTVSIITTNIIAINIPVVPAIITTSIAVVVTIVIIIIIIIIIII